MFQTDFFTAHVSFGLVSKNIFLLKLLDFERIALLLGRETTSGNRANILQQ